MTLKNMGYPSKRLSAIIEGFEVGVSVLAADRAAVGTEHGVLKVSAISEGRFSAAENKVIRPSELRRMGPSIRTGDILISRANTLELVGVAARVETGSDHLHLSDKTWRACLLEDDEGTRSWLVHVLNSSIVRDALRVRATGTSGSMKNISQAAYLGIAVPIPSRDERRRIAAVLDDLTGVVGSAADLVRAKRRFKRGVMQQLLSPSTTKENVDSWRHCRLGDLFTERAEADRPELPLLAVTNSRGIILRERVERRDSSNPDKSRYLHVAAGDIVYNTMRMWQGVSACAELEGIVSPAYTVCVPDGHIDGEFAAVLFKYPPVVHLFKRHSQGLVKDTLNLKFNQFARIAVRIPDLKQQRRIAAVFSAIDREIAQLEQLIGALARQKRAVLDKLLSGELRLPTA